MGCSAAIHQSQWLTASRMKVGSPRCVTYAYHDIGVMLDDLGAGKIGGVMKLAPVMHWMIRNRPQLRVVQERITDERLGVAVRQGNDALREAINGAQARLQQIGVLPQLVKKWLQA